MVKRVFQLVVLFFAIYAFVFVPLGRKTALEHVRAIAGTPAAQQAASELQGGVKRLVHELREEAQRATEATDEKIAASEEPEPPPAAPDRGKPAPKARPQEAGTSGARPRKAPERLSRGPAGEQRPGTPSLDPSNFNHPPDLKELRSLQAPRPR
jgi:hypothetical protein